MTDVVQYDLVVAFDDDSASFVHGFEAGGLWEKMKLAPASIEKTVHTANETTIRRMARAEGYSIDWRNSDVDGWAYLVLTKTMLAKGEGDPIATGRLSIIEGGLN
jgi:hypothetical protein